MPVLPKAQPDQGASVAAGMTDDDVFMVPMTRRVLHALGRVPKITTIGDDSDSIVLQDFWAQARALIEPLPAPPGTQIPLETRAAQARLRKAN